MQLGAEVAEALCYDVLAVVYLVVLPPPEVAGERCVIILDSAQVLGQIVDRVKGPAKGCFCLRVLSY